MPTLQDVCKVIEGSRSDAPLLRQACALPLSRSDTDPLPEPHMESPFDSSWEVLLSEYPG